MPSRKQTPAIVQPALMPYRAAIYTRVSTDDQAEQGYGLDVQRARCSAQIVAKGWTLAGEYTDDGISGTKDETQRPGLAALLKASQDGQIDAAVVLALDRLGRNTMLVLTLVDRLTKAGVALVSCKESLDTSTPQGAFVLTMFAALAQLERDMIVERTTAGRDERGRRDGEKGGRVPMGYVRLPDAAVGIDQQAAERVIFIFNLRRQGLTMQAIAERLNAMGCMTPRGYQWHASSVKAVLDNEADYRGGKRGESGVCWPVILAA